jgi:FkbM family methyltransferase
MAATMHAVPRVATSVLTTTRLLSRYASLPPPLLQSCRGETVSLDGLRLRIPGPLAIRASVLAGNVRMRAIIDAVVRPGATAVDVGAQIGVIAAYAAQRVGPSGRVVAIEPAQDNLDVLRENLRANNLEQVVVAPMAAGKRRETRRFYLRGDVSAVNSLFPDSCYSSVTDVASVEVAPLDDLVKGDVDLVKIDVEGAELEVLEGMPRLLAQRSMSLVVEWHPALQRAAGYAPDALPGFLLDAGFDVQVVRHISVRTVRAGDIAALAARLLRAQRAVELFCAWPPLGPLPVR